MAHTVINRPVIAVAFFSMFGFAFGLFFPYEPIKLFFFGCVVLALSLKLVYSSNMIYLFICFLSILKADLVVQQHLNLNISFYDNQVKNVKLEILKPPKLSKHSSLMKVSVNIFGEHQEQIPAILLYQTQNKASERFDFQPGDHIRGLVKIKKLKLGTGIDNRFDIWRQVHELTQPHYLLTLINNQHKNAKYSTFIIEHSYRQQVLHSLYNKLGTIVPLQDVIFIAGLVFGDTSKMPNDAAYAYTILGISHILAVSGMNIELLIRPLLWLARVCGIPYRLSSCITSLVITCFGWLTSGGASILRAVIAGDIWLFGHAFNRKPDAMTSLAISILVCLWWNPLNLADIGFQFSFMAALFLILFSPLFKHLLRKKSFLKWVGFDVFCAATAATLPIQLYVFQQWSPYSIVANLLFEPLIPIVMIMVLYLIICTYLFFPIAVGLGWIVDKLLWILRVPPVWVLQHEGIYFLQMRPDEAVWLFFIYVIAAFIVLGGSIKFMNTNKKMGNDNCNDQNHEERVKTCVK